MRVRHSTRNSKTNEGTVAGDGHPSKTNADRGAPWSATGVPPLRRPHLRRRMHVRVVRGSESVSQVESEAESGARAIVSGGEIMNQRRRRSAKARRLRLRKQREWLSLPRVRKTIRYAMAYGAGAQKIKEFLRREREAG